MDPKWYEDHAELCAFARAVVQGESPLDSGSLSAGEVVYLFEKPWKWDEEYQAWKAAQQTKAG